MKIFVRYRDECYPCTLPARLRGMAWYEKICRIVLNEINSQTPLFITIITVDEQRMRELAGAYKGTPRVTDVLSFLYPVEDGETRQEAEIFICSGVAQRQAQRYRVSLVQEYVRLVTHGMLHICGYNHVLSKERAVMRRHEGHIMRLCKKSKLI